MSVVDRLMTMAPEDRSWVLGQLSLDERRALSQHLDWLAANPWRQFVDDPVAFVEDGLGETLWSKQREILESLLRNKRTAVPACHAPGKSHIAARAVAWWIACHPPGTARVVTTASTFRQVKGVMWPHIRRVHARYDLPGEVFTTEWKLDDVIVADGFSPAEHNEAAVQGIHAPHLLVVVDEAGGIGPNLGRALEALMTGDHTRLLVLGNPPVDREGSWFQRLCSSDLYHVIPISVFDTPAWTGEDAGMCRACPPDSPSHPVLDHLVDQRWVDEVITEFGADSAFVEARVYARFPTITADKVVPITWVEAAQDRDPLPEGDVRLGVDVAADGGDELAIAEANGWNVRIVHSSSGAANASAVDVAAKVMEFVHAAVEEQGRRPYRRNVEVRIDAIGLGWGVASLLKAWVGEQGVPATIVPVNVAKTPRATRFVNQRAEMWWNIRQLLQPGPDGVGELRLDVDRRTVAQLTAPTYKSDSAGRIAIEKKADMAKRGVGSPDRAEAILLALYEPPGSFGSVPAPVGFTQPNAWDLGRL